ncbi:hypothetical protein K7432_009527 [Basidiobolus ranarum]|uniref:Phosphoglycerate mutase n=1 Tax=Basidiobolus ranarum TaxID=34480 RepID=A0ABR2VWY1_9FUNG
MTELYSRLSITIARHGETDYNKPPIRLQGHLDVPLNATGRRQAKALGDRLSSEEFDLIYCSDLSRTKQTLEPLLEYKKEQRVVYEPRLRERDTGALTDVLWSEAQQIIDAAGQTFEEYVSLSGESATQFYDRVSRFWDSIISTYLAQNGSDKDQTKDELKILIVTHGGVIVNLLTHLTKELQYQSSGAENWKKLAKNTAIYRIQVGSQLDVVKGDILLANCSTHLDDVQNLDILEQHNSKLVDDFAQKMKYY